jgi:hypothetical protein
MTTDNLQRHAEEEHDKVVAKLDRAKSIVAKEIEANEGIYPHNKGRVTQAELCRRAGIGKATLQGPAHKDTTRVAINDWLKALSRGVVQGHRNVRRTVTDRADEWNRLYGEIADSYAIAELELVEEKRKTARLERELAAASADLLALRSRGDTVVHLLHRGDGLR